MRRLDIGIASYGNPDGLRRLLTSIEQKSRTDYRVFIVSNPHPDEREDQAAMNVISEFGAKGVRFSGLRQSKNIGYVGAVNWILKYPGTEYIAYLDHDTQILTDGWDEIMASTLDRFHEIGMLFTGGGPYPINRGPYTEILWGVGCAWMLPRRVAEEVGGFDYNIGHHEEVDYQTRVRLAGLKIAAVPQVQIAHAAKASSTPDQQARISKGVIAWVDKWVKFFGGRNMSYYSPNVIRHEDWPPSALYLEEFWKLHLPNLNDSPETVIVNGAEYDLIKVPRLKGFYRHRVI